MLKTLRETDKKRSGDYEVADRMIATLEQWIDEDVSDESFLENDPLFTKTHEDYIGPNGTRITFSETRSPHNKWVKVEGYVDGDTVKSIANELTKDNPPALRALDTPEARQVKAVISDFVSDYTRHIFEPITKANGDIVYMLHSDPHVGNLMVSKDKKTGYVIDRSYYLELVQKDVDAIKNILSPTVSDWNKLKGTSELFIG